MMSKVSELSQSAKSKPALKFRYFSNDDSFFSIIEKHFPFADYGRKKDFDERYQFRANNRREDFINVELSLLRKQYISYINHSFLDLASKAYRDERHAHFHVSSYIDFVLWSENEKVKADNIRGYNLVINPPISSKQYKSFVHYEESTFFEQLSIGYNDSLFEAYLNDLLKGIKADGNVKPASMRIKNGNRKKSYESLDDLFNDVNKMNVAYNALKDNDIIDNDFNVIVNNQSIIITWYKLLKSDKYNELIKIKHADQSMLIELFKSKFKGFKLNRSSLSKKHKNGYDSLFDQYLSTNLIKQ